MKLLLGSIRAMTASTEILLTVMELVKQSCINAVNLYLSVYGSNAVKESTGRIIKLGSKMRLKYEAVQHSVPLWYIVHITACSAARRALNFL